MRNLARLMALGLLLSASASRADILPRPDRGPSYGSAAGLEFSVNWVKVPFPPRHPRYFKRAQAAILASCDDPSPNCRLARSRGVIGMEVLSVNGQDLRPENGLVLQILNAFAQRAPGSRVTLEFIAPGSRGEPIKVEFNKDR